jgi:hypothetical protein
MSSTITVKLDRAHLSARMKDGKAHCGPFLAQQILDDCRPFTPHDQGTLEDSGRVEQVGEDWAATWNTVYAAYQYYGCWPDGTHVIRNHNTSINPQATTQWAEAARDQYGSDWDIVAQREFVKGAGG